MFSVSSPFREDPFFNSTIKNFQQQKEDFFAKEFNTNVSTPSVFTTTTQKSETRQEQSSSNKPTPSSSRPTNSQTNENSSSSEDEQDTFTVKVDVQQYTPEELEVKTVDNFICISGKHEEKKEDGTAHVSRQFSRRYGIPRGVKPEAITCKLTSEGVMVLSAPRIVDKPKPIANQINISISSSSKNQSSSKEI
jgi:HSP20 family molecular chaperone IbpA